MFQDLLYFQDKNLEQIFKEYSTNNIVNKKNFNILVSHISNDSFSRKDAEVIFNMISIGKNSINLEIFLKFFKHNIPNNAW